MEPQGLLLYSQGPTTCPNSEPPQSGPCPPPNAWRSILILSSHLCLGLPSDLFPSDFPTKTLYAPFLSPIHASSPAHFILHVLITQIIITEAYRSLSSSLCSLLHSCLTLSLLDPNIFLSILFSNTLSLYSSLNASDQFSHPYKTTSKIIFMCGPRTFIQYSQATPPYVGSSLIQGQQDTPCTMWQFTIK